MIIILFAIPGIYYVSRFTENKQQKQMYILVLSGLILVCLIDFIRKSFKSSRYSNMKENNTVVNELLLVDDHDIAVKRWDLKGKVSLIIGRSNGEEVIDIDLSDSEYEGFVDVQHALLNYAAGSWYIEDLYSINGIRIRKQQDGVCYRLSKNRPCRLESGDIIMIANTRLLLQ